MPQTPKTSASTAPDPLGDLFARYRRAGRPITVNFRELVPHHNSPDRVTHLIHSYPAKVISHIPAFCLGSRRLSRPEGLVLDPFCGTGTVLVEAVLAGRRAIGADANPLARLIAKVKSTPIERRRLSRSLSALNERIRQSPSGSPPGVVNLDYWFHPHVIRQLTCLREAITATRDDAIRDFFWVCFSQCVRRVSLADPRLSVPVKLKVDQYPKGHWLGSRVRVRLAELQGIRVNEIFNDIASANARRLAAFTAAVSNGASARVLASDARCLRDEFGAGASGKRLPAGSVGLIITSPPYAGAQKYVRASSLSLGWLGLCEPDGLRSLEEASIGREHFCADSYDQFAKTDIPAADRKLEAIYEKNPLRAHIAATYLREMRAAMAESTRVLRSEGHLVLVVANNTICGKEFQTASYVRHLAEETGLQLQLALVDHIRSRGLMTKRNHAAKPISREWVFFFRKGE